MHLKSMSAIKPKERNMKVKLNINGGVSRLGLVRLRD